jgi:hypothetical protein
VGEFVVRKILAVLAILAFFQFAPITGQQTAQASVSCTSLEQRMEGFALSRGDAGAAARIRTLCQLDCPGIHSFYLWLPSAYSKFDAEVLALWKQCTSGSNGGGTPPPCSIKNFTASPVPKISGQLKTGYELSVKIGTWKPTPTYLTTNWYRSGHLISVGDNYLVTSADLGKNISVSVQGSMHCYKSKTVSSAKSSKVVDGKLRKMPSTALALSQQDGQNLQITYTGRGIAEYTGGISWTWLDHPATEWADQNANLAGVSLPKVGWNLADSSGTVDLCENQKHFRISARVSAQVPGIYSPTLVNLPEQDFVCSSTSAGLLQVGHFPSFSNAQLEITQDQYGSLEITSGSGAISADHVEWLWSENPTSTWTTDYTDSLTAELPTVTWLYSGQEVEYCLNHKTYTISARVHGSIAETYDADWNQIASKVFTCTSPTDSFDYERKTIEGDLPSFSLMNLPLKFDGTSLYFDKWQIFSNDISNVTWTWKDHAANAWADEFTNNQEALLPYETWYTADSNFDGIMDYSPQKICRNGTSYSISASITAAIAGKYSSGTKDYPIGTYVCSSNTRNYVLKR